MELLVSDMGGNVGVGRGNRRKGKLNAILLRMIHGGGGGGGTTKEEAVKAARRFVESQKEELLRLVVKETGNVVPRA